MIASLIAGLSLTTTAFAATKSVKMGKSGVYYVPNTTYYNQTKNYIPYSTLQACLTAGEKISKKLRNYTLLYLRGL